jgi:hypothetical protein
VLAEQLSLAVGELAEQERRPAPSRAAATREWRLRGKVESALIRGVSRAGLAVKRVDRASMPLIVAELSDGARLVVLVVPGVAAD